MKNNPFAIAQKYLAKPMGTPGTPAESRAVSVEDDPVLPLGAWYPVFREHHLQAVSRIPDWAWLRSNRLDLYQAIRAKEDELDALRDARLSEVMAIMRQWRELMLQAEFERRKPKID